MVKKLIGKINPKQIAIMAPVIYRNGEPNLMSKYPEEINRRFHFVTFVVDDERARNEVIPGIGGMVYSRLGLGDMKEKTTTYQKWYLRSCKTEVRNNQV